LSSKKKVNPYMFTNLPSVIYMLYSFFVYLVRFCMSARHSLYFVCFCMSTGYFYFDFFCMCIEYFHYFVYFLYECYTFSLFCIFCMSIVYFPYFVYFSMYIGNCSAHFLLFNVVYTSTLSSILCFYYYIIKGKGEMYCKIHVLYGHSHCMCDQSGVT
jgi:hypothetical protein